MRLEKTKIGVFGIQGSGKTYLIENYLIKSFKKPLVYLIHTEDFQKAPSNVTIYIPQKIVKGKKILDRSPEHLDIFLGQFIEEAKKGKYDAFILDEASTFLPKNLISLQKYPNIIDLIDNHRHYNLAFIYATRRPQAISTEITETSEFIFLFAIDGRNIRGYFGDMHEEYKKLMPLLSKRKHNFIFRELGKTPKLFNKIVLKGGELKKEDGNKRNQTSPTNNESPIK